MDYFFSRIGRGFRYTTTILGSISCATVIVLGALGIQTIAIPICGGIALIPMAMVMMENVKHIRDMENLVSQFKSETANLKVTNDKLKQTEVKLGCEVDALRNEKEGIIDAKNDLVQENNRLEYMLGEAETNLKTIKNLARRYQTTSEQLGENLKKSEQNQEILKQQAEELITIKEEYQEQNNQLKDNYEKASQQLVAITTAKEEYERQLNEMSNNNLSLQETTELLKSELSKTQSSYEDAKAALKTLLQTTGVLHDLGEDMIKTEQKTEENVSMMTKIMNMFGMSRSEELFNNLDRDKDGLLSVDEFVNIILDNTDTNNTDTNNINTTNN